MKFPEDNQQLIDYMFCLLLLFVALYAELLIQRGLVWR